MVRVILLWHRLTTQMVRPYLKSLWHGQDNSAGNSKRQGKRRENNISVWIGLEFGVENRTGWRWMLKSHLWCTTTIKVKELN